MVKRKKRKYTKRAKKSIDVSNYVNVEVPMSQKQFVDLRFNCLQQALQFDVNLRQMNQDELMQMANKLFIFCTTGKIRQRKGK